MRVLEATVNTMLKNASLVIAIFGALMLCADVALARSPAGPSGPVPEIDPGSLASAVALVLGGMAVVRGRIRR